GPGTRAYPGRHGIRHDDGLCLGNVGPAVHPPDRLDFGPVFNADGFYCAGAVSAGRVLPGVEVAENEPRRRINMRAVCLLSVGLDWSPCVARARRDGFTCYALSLDYGQRHRVELAAAARVAESLGAAQHLVVSVDLRFFGASALTSDIAVPKGRGADEMSGE